MNRILIIGISIAVCSCKGLKSHDSSSSAANGSDSVTEIWEKKSGNLVHYSQGVYVNGFFVSLDNITSRLSTGQIDWGTNTIYSSVAAEKMVGILPDIKPDDNPIVVEIKLKSR